MSNILSNSQFFHQRYGGVTRYSLSLTEKMIENNINFKIYAPIYKNIYLKNISKKYVFGYYFSKYPNLTFLRYINNSILNFFLKKNKVKLVHFMYDPENIPNLKYKKKIITIHDTIHEKFSENYKDNFFSKRKMLLEKMDKIICVSENTKNDLIEFYNLDQEKIKVIYNGSDHLINLETFNNINNKFFKKPYILFVGSRSKYKNFKLFVESYKKSKRILDNFNIICFGGGNFSKNEINFFKDLKITNNISSVSGDDKKLKFFYQNASMFIYPSLYEGFGIPILEAMHEGCPTLASDIPVFKEILGQNGNYFNPRSHDDLIFNMEEILFNDQNNKNLVSNGKIISKKYSWSKCYNKTIEFYN